MQVFRFTFDLSAKSKTPVPGDAVRKIVFGVVSSLPGRLVCLLTGISAVGISFVDAVEREESPAERNAQVLPCSVTFDVKIPVETWIDYLTQCNDIFSSNYCGYWLRAIERSDERGWLCFDACGGEYPDHGDEPEREAAFAAWKTGKPLPENWLRLDRDTAARAFIEGVKLWGLRWRDSEHNDAHGYGVVIQHAFFGELRY